MAHHFFAYLSRMKFIKRWGLMRNTIEENDMEHSMQAAMIAHGLALIGNRYFQKNWDANLICTLALYHDATEVLTGDLPTPIKHNNPAIKEEYGKIADHAARRLLEMLPRELAPDYAPLIMQEEVNDVARLVKAADNICAYLKCVEELKGGNSEFQEARDTILAGILQSPLPEVRYFMQHFVPGFSMTLDQISK